MVYGLASSNPADFFRIRESYGPSKSTSDATVAPIEKSRKEQRKVERTKDQGVRHAFMKIPSKEEKRDQKERKVSSNHTAALKYSFALEARKETIKELQLLKDLKDDPVVKENLVTFLKTPNPVLQIVETSGKF
jgi:Zn-dependent metalloprotease